MSSHHKNPGAGVAQSVWCLTTDWTTEVRSPTEAEDFSSSLSPGPRPAALGPTQPPVQWIPGVYSPWGKARPRRDADHSPPSSAEDENE
jgi:hypothetical protein